MSIISIAGCGSLAKKSVLINAGDNKESVLEVMGKPDDRQFKGHNEAWQYCENDAGFGYDDYRIIWLYEGKVTGVTSYKNSEFGSCAGYFKEIKWNEAPDTAIEVRHR